MVDFILVHPGEPGQLIHALRIGRPVPSLCHSVIDSFSYTMWILLFLLTDTTDGPFHTFNESFLLPFL